MSCASGELRLPGDIGRRKCRAHLVSDGTEENEMAHSTRRFLLVATARPTDQQAACLGRLASEVRHTLTASGA